MVPPRGKVAIGVGVVGIAGGAYYWKRHRDAAAAESDVTDATADPNAIPDPGYDPYGGYGSTYLSPSTSGVGGGGYGGTGTQQGTTLADILPLLEGLNTLPPGVPTGGGNPAPVPVPSPHPLPSPTPIPSSPAPAPVPAPPPPSSHPAPPPPVHCPPGFPHSNGPPGPHTCYKDCGHDECRKHKRFRDHGHCYADGHRVHLNDERLPGRC